jgi:hypothetical protein
MTAKKLLLNYEISRTMRPSNKTRKRKTPINRKRSMQRKMMRYPQQPLVVQVRKSTSIHSPTLHHQCLTDIPGVIVPTILISIWKRKLSDGAETVVVVQRTVMWI